jgi:hypothetical protein
MIYRYFLPSPYRIVLPPSPILFVRQMGIILPFFLHLLKFQNALGKYRSKCILRTTITMKNTSYVACHVT